MQPVGPSRLANGRAMITRHAMYGLTRLLLLLALVGGVDVAAHEVGLSRSTWAVSDGDKRVSVELVFARPDVLTLAPGADSNGDGVIGDGEVGAVVTDAVWGCVVVVRGGVACGIVVGDAGVVEGDGVALAADVDCGAGHGGVDATLGFIAPLGAQHRHIAEVLRGDGGATVVAYADNATVALLQAPAGAPVAEYLWLGVEHILTGYDHLCFVLGLIIVLVVAGRPRSVLAIITAFTLAHSITLGLSALGAVQLPSALVESIIALSIVVVGVDSWRRPDPKGRWLISFPFGLIHGFGFAGVLGEIGLPAGAAVPALGLFNLGVELGQLGVVLAVAPLLWLARTRLDLSGRVVVNRVVSAGIIAVGAYWFIERAVG